MAKEIARQLRIRNIGGIVVIDFIAGMVLSDESLFIRVKKKVRQMTNHRPEGKLTLVFHPSMLPYFQERKEDLVRSFRREFTLNGDVTLHRDDYRIVLE